MYISIVICTHNRCESLRDTLQSIKEMYFPEDISWELIVVDNNSKDNTKVIVEEFMRDSGLNIKYIFEEKEGVSYARNKGVREVKGEIVSFIDDDVMVTRDWLINVCNGFKTYDPVILGGKVLIKNDLQMPKWLSEKAKGPLGIFDIGDDVVIADRRYNGIIGIGGNMSFKKMVFDKYGLFMTNLGRKSNKLYMGEETELYWRVKNNHEKSVYYPFAVVYHSVKPERMTKGYIRRWYFRIGEYESFLANAYIGNKSRQVLGVPRWVYRKIFEDILSMLWHTIKGSKAEAFGRELSVIKLLGCCAYNIKQIMSFKNYGT